MSEILHRMFISPGWRSVQDVILVNQLSGQPKHSIPQIFQMPSTLAVEFFIIPALFLNTTLCRRAGTLWCSWGCGTRPGSSGKAAWIRPGAAAALIAVGSAERKRADRCEARSSSRPPAYVPSFLKASNFLNGSSVPQDQDAALWEPSSVNRLKTVRGNRGPARRGTPIGGEIWINERLCCRLQA